MQRTEREIDRQMAEVLLRLRGARVNTYNSQAEAAAVIGLHRPAYTLIEQGKQQLTLRQFIALAHFFAVPLHWLTADDIYHIEGKPWAPHWWHRWSAKVRDEIESQRQTAESIAKLKAELRDRK